LSKPLEDMGLSYTVK